MKTEQPEIRELTEREVAFVSFSGNYMGNPQIFQDLFDKLIGWVGPKGLISPESVFLSAYQDDPDITPPDELKLELCMGIPGDVQVDGDMGRKVLPGGRYAVMRAELTGPEEYGPAWSAVVEWMNENDHEIDMSRPSYETYLNNPDEHPEKHHMIDICMSAKSS